MDTTPAVLESSFVEASDQNFRSVTGAERLQSKYGMLRRET